MSCENLSKKTKIRCLTIVILRHRESQITSNLRQISIIIRKLNSKLTPRLVLFNSTLTVTIDPAVMTLESFSSKTETQNGIR